MNGPGDLLSVCNTSYRTMNLRTVAPNSVRFISSKDHSKWAAATDSNLPFVCVGDINRQVGRAGWRGRSWQRRVGLQKSQAGRGGGTLCLSNAAVWRSYNDAVVDVERCPLPVDDDGAAREYDARETAQALTICLVSVALLLCACPLDGVRPLRPDRRRR